MTPRSSCPGGEHHSSPGHKPPAHYEINTVTETAPRLARLPAGVWLSYKLPGSFLASTGGMRSPGICGVRGSATTGEAANEFLALHILGGSERGQEFIHWAEVPTAKMRMGHR